MAECAAKKSHSYDEALVRVGTGRFHMAALLVVGVCMLAALGEGLNMAFVLPVAKCDLDITTSMQGLINASGFIGIILTSHMWGFLADTWGRQKVLRTSLGLAFVSCLLSSMSYNSLMLLLTRLAVGLSISGVQAAGISYLGEFHCDANRAKYVTLAVAGMPIAIIYQSVLGLVVLPMTWEFPFFGLVYKPWRMFLVLNSSIIGLVWFMMVFMPESPKFLLIIGKKAEAMNVLRHVYVWNTRQKVSTFSVQSVSLESNAPGSNLADVTGVRTAIRLLWNQTWPLFYPPYLNKNLIIYVISFAAFFVSHGFYLWLPQILYLYSGYLDEAVTTCTAIHLGNEAEMQKDEGRIENTSLVCVSAKPVHMIYIITTLYGVCFLFMYVISSVLIKRIGNITLIVVWLLIISFATLILEWTKHFYLNVVLFMLLNSAAPCASLISAIVADFFPTQYKGMALCMIYMVSRLGSIAGSNVVGVILYDQCAAWIGVNACLMLVCACLYYYMMRAHKKSPKTEIDKSSSPGQANKNDK